MKFKLLILSLLIASGVISQTVLMKEHVDSTYQKSKFGVNSTHHIHAFYAFGFVFDEYKQENLVTKFGGTNSLSLGLRYKYRITNHIATGVEVEYLYSTYSLPTHKPRLKNKYLLHNCKYALYMRFNIGMRGNIMGKFVDLGVYGSSNFGSHHYVKKQVDFSDYKTLKYYEGGLSYIEPFNYGLILRVGVNQFVLFSEYRFSDIVKENYDQLKAFPKWTVGLQIGLHR